MRPAITAAITLAAIGLIVLATSGRVEAGSTHVVQPGETLYRIALRYGLTVGALAAYNGLSDPTVIHPGQVRSEEHTSELQSLAYLVCRLLLEKKKKKDVR